MGKLLQEAFKKREGHQDHETFIDVVEAFFQEYEQDDTVLVPVAIKNEATCPGLLPMGNGKYALIVVTDWSYLYAFKEKSNMGMTPKNLVRIMKESENVEGIIINPTSPSHCFLPKNDIIGVLSQME